MIKLKSFDDICIGDTFYIITEYDKTTYTLLEKNNDTICIGEAKPSNISFSVPANMFDLAACYGQLYKKEKGDN